MPRVLSQAPTKGHFNVIKTGKRPAFTLTPTLALKDGKPYLAFSVQGGDGRTRTSCSFSLILSSLA